jgi:hypothetical protein
MDTAFIRKNQQISHLCPKIVSYGNVNLTLYKRTTASGSVGFMLAYRQDGKRKFDSFSDEDTAVQAANTKAHQLSTLGVKAAQISDDDMRMCVAAMDAAKSLGLSVAEIVSRYPGLQICSTVTLANTAPGVSAWFGRIGSAE